MKALQIVSIFAVTSVGFAAQASEALLTMVKGPDCQLETENAVSFLVPFMKVRTGDRLALGPGCTAQVLYTGAGRQETWNGAVTLTIGEQQSQPNGTVVPVVKILPSAALNRLAKAPGVLTDIRSRTGMVMVRSGGLLDKLRETEALYNEMRGVAMPDDITPELYLMSALYELKLFRDVEEIVAEIVARQPDNSEAKSILENIRKAMEVTGDSSSSAK